jgi:hypothetical protein
MSLSLNSRPPQSVGVNLRVFVNKWQLRAKCTLSAGDGNYYLANRFFAPNTNRTPSWGRLVGVFYLSLNRPSRPPVRKKRNSGGTTTLSGRLISLHVHYFQTINWQRGSGP